MTELEEQKSPSDLIKEERLNATLQSIREAIATSEEDDGASLAKGLQGSREFLLDLAMKYYLERPSAKALEGILGLLAQLEGSLRSDRKEKAKKEEALSNAQSFNLMVEALEKINSSAITVPKFDLGNFVLDPTRSLLEAQPEVTFVPINEEELEQGMKLVDIDGQPI